MDDVKQVVAKYKINRDQWIYWFQKPQYTDDTPEVFTHSVRTLRLSTRARNRLMVYEIETVGELASVRPDELIRFRGTGKAVVKECVAALEKFGLHLGALEREG